MKILNAKLLIFSATIVAVVIAIIISNVDDDLQMPHPDTSDINVDVKIERFYRDLTQHIPADSTDILRLKNKYGSYFNSFCEFEIEVGSPDSARIVRNINGFLHWENLPEVLSAIDSVFTDEVFAHIEERLSDAFACINVLLPELSTPMIACHCSGFNSNIFVDSTYISFCAEHYLGSECRFYEWLQTPKYSRRAKHYDYIAADIVKCWLYAHYPDLCSQHDVLSAMIYQGKILYATRRLMPTEPLKNVFGFNGDDMEWCKAHEKQLWTGLIDRQLLYNNTPMEINKLVRDAPFTAQFGQNTPGRAVLFCAFNIVARYAAAHPDLSLADLLAEPDAQKILMGAHYAP